MFLGCGKDKHHISGRLFESFKEGVERSLRQHVHLIDDKYTIFTCCWGYLHLVNKCANIIYTIIGSSIELNDVERTVFVKCATRVTLIASITLGGAIHTVDCLGKDTRTRGLPHPTRATEKVGMRQAVGSDRVFKCRRERLLSHDRVESRWAIFSS